MRRPDHRATRVQAIPAWLRYMPALAAACFVLPAWAQGIRVSSSLSVQESFTHRDEKGLGGSDRTELLTTVSPSVSLSSSRGPLQGQLHYTLNGVASAQDSARNTVYHSLSSSGSLISTDRRFGINATASAGRQVISPYSVQAVDDGRDSNRAQTFSYGFSPFVTARLLGEVDFRGQLAYSATQTDRGELGESSSLAGTLSLSGGLGRLGWNANAGRTIVESAGSTQGRNDRVGATFSFSPDIDWRFLARLGSEAETLRQPDAKWVTTYGAGVTWVPGPRTSASFDYEKRFFGSSHSISVSHRMARSSLSYSDSRSLQTGGVVGQVSVSNYELFFFQFASIEPDPVKRDALVRSFLAAAGLDPEAREIISGGLTTGSSVQRSQRLSASYQGLRTVFTLGYSRSKSQSLAADNANPSDPLAPGPQRQSGFTLSVSYRLLPDSSLSASASQQRTPRGSAGQEGHVLNSFSVNGSVRLGRRISLSLGMRFSDFNSATAPYQESALNGSLSMQF